MKLNKMDVFVFGSNAAGIHGAGAALEAVKHGMPYGRSYGHYGQAFGIPTKDEYVETLVLKKIEYYVHGFLAYAHDKRKHTFKVTQLGCGLAGYTAEQIAPLFEGASLNCQFDTAWRPILGEEYNYWGTQ